jgi:hypothetical protein
MNTRIQYIAGALALLLLLFILELVRRRRLQERYALIWVVSGVIVLVFAVWRGLLNNLSSALGIAVPTNALFVVVFGFVLALLLHFSLTVTRLSEESKILAQELARVEQELEALRTSTGPADLTASTGAQQGSHPRPVDAQQGPDGAELRGAAEES